ncbi:NAD-dependent epimerase/dehydratase family protein [Salinadaptatus halalkaliphilus]|uniref:NAD-dependent epimerase/dehydratase family protein n=1 Tax=Salinadaptatus halalkaliphilus TaxID=2419781 RepID=A0A4S3THS2_9EURY|nr:NAD(P)H-binding protein [Salinadaptatus halalkaliphilus]THE63466.1 NAD-dependent epimerase/dehydratase family protein [Salinadaptatus halalkaliphilus]
MDVFVAGSTGVLGRRIVAQLTDRGHDVVGLVRDDGGAALVRDRGATPRQGDVLDRSSLVDAVDDTDVVVHAATAIPTGSKPSKSDWERNDRIRTTGTRTLLETAQQADADRFLMQSVVWVARQPDGSAFDERSTPTPDRTTRSALEAERLLERRAADSGLDTVTLRGGWFYAHDSAHTRRFGRDLLAGRMPIVGGGLLGRSDATLSTIHVDDAAAAFVAAAEGDATGLYHVVDDEPVTLAAFLRTFADCLEAASPRRLPGWLARAFVGRDTVRLLTNSMPTTNDRVRETFDWEPAVPTYEQGLERVTERWLEDGRIRETTDGYEWVGEA